ncbi:MAG: DUF3574 domain-containing protein [Alphaproteobacteria bacterium]|nr:MAG: DUF3574 domain-containing protein [Alphaproteobacteria bacterium]
MKALALFLAMAVGTPVFADDPCPPGAGRLVETRLYLGRDIGEGDEVSPADFTGFLEGEVVPRFPAGFTVLDGAGYWRGCTALDEEGGCERMKMLIVLHAGTADADTALAAIARAYAVRFRQQAVLKTDSITCMAILGPNN